MQDKKFNLSIMSSMNQQNSFSTINCSFMQMVMTTSPITLPRGHQDKHDYYEFLIPLSSITQLYVEDLELDCHPGHLIPINPGQTHGVKSECKTVSYILVFFDQANLNRLIRQIIGDTFNYCFPVDSYPLKTDIQLLISRMIHENRSNECGREILMQCLTEELAVLLIRHYYHHGKQAELITPDRLSGDQARFQNVVIFMQKQYAGRLSIEKLAELSGMNSFHFIRTFKRVFNISPYSFLTRIRICNAKRLLIQTTLPASEICKLCGFQSASRFSAVFQKDTGLTPSRFRKENGPA
jgi:AraC-like DNA-binding protein